MAVRVRPATTVLVLLAIAFAFQLMAVLTVPVTKSIYLSSYQGYKFGVFGLCSGDTCTSIQIGYSTDDINDLSGFTLPSNARHSVSKLLIVHPISAGFTLILMICTIVLHWHGPSTSMRFLFFLLLWTIPSFLLSLLSFLVDILLFVPHLAWGGWIVLSATVLIAVCTVLLCIMRRTASSRKSSRLGKLNAMGDEYYQLAPLSYGYGTVDGASDYKAASLRGYDSNDESAPFVHEGNTTALENSLQRKRTSEDLNNYPSTTLYDTMRSSNNPSAQSARSRYGAINSPIAAPSTTYRGGYDPYINPILPYDENNNVRVDDVPTAPYPTDIPSVNFSNNNSITQVAPYPTDIPGLQSSSNPRLLPSSPTKPQGPRPMPNSQPTTPILLPEVSQFDSSTHTEDHNVHQPELVVDRQPSFRTKIEQTLNALSPAVDSSDDLSKPFDLSTSPPKQRDIGVLSIDDTDDITEHTSQDLTQDTTDKEDEGIFPQSNPSFTRSGYEVPHQDEFYAQSTVKDGSINPVVKEKAHFNDDDASSFYSSHVPSVLATPTEPSFPKETSGSLSARYSKNILTIPEGSALQSIPTLSESSSIDYPFPDPMDRRVTPAPSFTNESLLSSTFTSVSQREINPRYLEQNPQEHSAILQREIQERLQSIEPRQQKRPVNTTDILIASNPDFTIKGSRPGRGGRRGL